MLPAGLLDRSTDHSLHISFRLPLDDFVCTAIDPGDTEELWFASAVHHSYETGQNDFTVERRMLSFFVDQRALFLKLPFCAKPVWPKN
jgi:hypothetical protein